MKLWVVFSCVLILASSRWSSFSCSVVIGGFSSVSVSPSFPSVPALTGVHWKPGPALLTPSSAAPKAAVMNSNFYCILGSNNTSFPIFYFYTTGHLLLEFQIIQMIVTIKLWKFNFKITGIKRRTLSHFSCFLALFLQPGGSPSGQLTCVSVSPVTSPRPPAQGQAEARAQGSQLCLRPPESGSFPVSVLQFP